MSTREPLQLDHALFGYSDGHRQIAASTKLPSKDLYTLSAASDLAGGLQLQPDESYVTGLPLAESKRYALMRTWPAPEMPRPGCVWSHVLLIDFRTLSAEGDLSEFLGLLTRPGKAERGFYDQPLEVTPSAPGSRALPDRATLMEIIAGYYSAGSVSLSPKTDARTLESVIMAVWSQQWPRLRASFSFRTAAVRERRKSELVSFDVRVNGAASRDGARLHGSIEMPPTTAWVVAAGDDAQSQTVTPLRRFLWRYGRDVVNSKKHFRTLVQLFLDAEVSGSELPTTAAAWLFREIPDPSDGETLKRDLLGFTSVAVPLCPAVSATGMLELLATTSIEPVFTVKDIAKRLSALPTAQFGQLTKYALLHERSLGRWSEIINSAIVASADLTSLQGDLPAATRLRILLSRPDLVHPTTIEPLSNEDILHIASKYHDSRPLAALSFVFVRRDSGLSQSRLLQSAPGPIYRAAVDAEIRGELHHSWKEVIKNGAHQILEIDWLDGLTKTSQLAIAIKLLGFPHDINTTSENLANIIFAMDDDASGEDQTNLLSFLVTEAFKKPAASGWRLVSLALAELRPLVLQGALPSPSFSMLADTLPRAGADPWDLNKRILLALHNLKKSCPDDNGVIGALNLSEKEMQVVINGPEHDFRRQRERSWNWFTS